MSGYPFCLDVGVAYDLGDSGLQVATTATNVGASRCPNGSGQHPYLSPGPGVIDGCSLRFRAGTRIATDDKRQLPTGNESVAGTDFDFSNGRTLGSQKLDSAFTDLVRDEDGRARVHFLATTDAGSNCGWTSIIRSSNCSPAIPSLPTAAIEASASNR